VVGLSVVVTSAAAELGRSATEERVMGRRGFLAILILFGVVWSSVPAQPPAKPDKPTEPRTYYLSVDLPRFDPSKIDEKVGPTFEELKAALKGVACLPKGVNASAVSGVGIELREFRKDVQFELLPTADSDIGDVAKALAKLGGDEKKPVAVVNLARRLPLTEDEFATIKKELAKAKGIDWEKSDRARGLALDGAGGARFLEIRAAFKKANAIHPDLDDK
jgi:hypothetical protein